ncbi:MAG: SpoIIE family protein phosphatase [Chlamydiae bacterium]|nr:SpoIIE family protein phosphatase [Chlamydiota bacterium]MBI3277384.1 SpoIIE family protein phosphatase [Chlamydiota bacterium]
MLPLLLVALLVTLFSYYRSRLVLNQLKTSYQTLSQEKEAVLTFIREIGEALTSAHELDELFHPIITCAKRLLNASSGAIFLLEEDHTHLKAKRVDGLFPPIFESIPTDALTKLATKAKYLQDLIMKIRIPLGEGIVGRVAQERAPILIENGMDDPRISQPPIDFLKVKTLMAVPLIFKDEMIGVMMTINKEDEKNFNENDLSLLEAISDQVALSIHNAKLYRTIAEKERLDKELKTATQVQHLLLPTLFPKISGFDFAGVSRPAREIGGDYYDFFPVGEGKYGIVIADVSGKGIPAALIMTMARSILRSVAPGENSPRHVLAELNRLLFLDMQHDMFISLAYLVLDEVNRKLTLTRAGHEPIILFDQKDNRVKLLRPQGIVLGIDEGPLFTSTLEEVVLFLNSGDVLALYTDGITEAHDASGQEFGYEALTDVIHHSSSLSAQEIAENILGRVARFTGGISQRDDMTFSIVKVL